MEKREKGGKERRKKESENEEERKGKGKEEREEKEKGKNKKKEVCDGCVRWMEDGVMGDVGSLIGRLLEREEAKSLIEALGVKGSRKA